MTDHVLLIRAVDAGATYVSFRWLDRADQPEVQAIAATDMRRVLRLLDAALIGPGADDDGESSVRQALTGPMTRYLSEYALSEQLTRAVLPESIRSEVRERATRGRVLIRITPSRSLARIPFELLIIDDPHRLVEVADVCYEPPSTVHIGRGRCPEPWTSEVAARPVLYSIDPYLPAGTGMRQILPAIGTVDAGNTALLAERIAGGRRTSLSGIHQPMGRWELRENLLENPGRWFYFGHVSATLDQPGSASVHLDDDGTEWGLATPVNNAHLPLSALDLLLGTAAPELGPSDREPAEQNQMGHTLWPMPPRVALIACESGVDYRSSETFGLVMAILSSGAEVLTTTRWTLPSDSAFSAIAGEPIACGPTTELALAVDDSHRADDPVAALARWQRTRLEQWRSDPGLVTSPITWASVATHLCPPREVSINGERVVR